MTPARRDGATSILVGDLTNKQRELIYDTLSIPPDKLKKSEFVSWCAGFIGRAHDYTFLAFFKEQRGQQLYLVRADSEDVTIGGMGASYGGAAAGGGGGGGGMSALSRELAVVDLDSDSEPAAGGGGGAAARPKQFGTFAQGGSRQESARDLYTTLERTITPLLPVLLERHKGAHVWEPCIGLANIADVLSAAGFSVVGTDLFSPDGALQPEESFIAVEHSGVSYAPCEVPEGVDIIVTNPPFSDKLAFIQRFFDLGIPVFSILPLETLTHKGCVALFKERGVELFILPGGSSASSFFKVSESRNVSVGGCAWFGFNTGRSGEVVFLE